ncbi:hypothetical protein [Sphingomonas sp. OK281]|uniref:hypothetical protein n=1 Tax=Sphingomonas sp. OK281 TaxID=1881067 RepID=UPI0011142E4E|nr:hypothetical protein [Sphingomonas sp. OK281]
MAAPLTQAIDRARGRFVATVNLGGRIGRDWHRAARRRPCKSVGSAVGRREVPQLQMMETFERRIRQLMPCNCMIIRSGLMARGTGSIRDCSLAIGKCYHVGVNNLGFGDHKTQTLPWGG